MDVVRIIFGESMKALGLVFLGLLAVKTVSALRTQSDKSGAKRLGLVKSVLYLIVLALVVLGARSVGTNVAASFYRWASENNLRRSDLPTAYANAQQAVRLRPDVIANWRALATIKLAEHQYQSLLDDLPAFRSLAGGDLDEEDAYRFALCYFFLGQYDNVVKVTDQLVLRNRIYAAPLILQGMAYTALRKYAEAEWSFLAVLRQFPTNQSAVEGLAHQYFLAGKRARAVEVLNETARFGFSPEARRRFETLKRLYAQ